jgi:putative hydrolase of the HAD superfamily
VIRAVLFDLDDTLYDQQAWLAGAWRSVAEAAAAFGVAPAELGAALAEIAAEGSDRGRIIDRALERVGAAGVPADPLVQAFRSHAPERLAPYPGVPAALERLRARYRIGLVTDGDPGIQRAKLRALGLGDAFDVVVLSDELGRGYRKPHPAPFRAALFALGVAAQEALFVGDRPDKDVAGAAAAGMACIRVLTGEYAGLPDTVAPLVRVPGVADAIASIEGLREARVLDELKFLAVDVAPDAGP